MFGFFNVVLVGLSVIVTLILTIVLAVTVVPDKKKDKLKGFARTLNDIFNFRGLLIESIVRFLYLLSTVACIVTGFFMMFMVVRVPVYSGYYGETVYATHWYGWVGILLIIFGPILLRLVFEGAMLFILLVKNTIQINNKLEDPKKQAQKPAAPAAQNPHTAPQFEAASNPAGFAPATHTEMHKPQE